VYHCTASAIRVLARNVLEPRMTSCPVTPSQARAPVLLIESMNCMPSGLIAAHGVEFRVIAKQGTKQVAHNRDPLARQPDDQR